jgi:hypothetical protein
MNPGEALPLRDIVLPAEPSWWPPAPGWWLLALVLLGVLVVVARALHRRWRHARRRRRRVHDFEQALQALRGRPTEQLSAASEYLRRLSRQEAPDALLLRGDAWLQFLDRGLPERPFSDGAGRLLCDGAFRATVVEAEVDAALQVVRRRIALGMSQ